MERTRIVNDDDLDQWVCETCLEELENDGVKFDVIDHDRDPEGDGCAECGESDDFEDDVCHEDENNSTKFGPGRYYIGDPCYVIRYDAPDGDNWAKLLELLEIEDGQNYRNGDVEFKGERLWMHGTAHGDGGYVGSDGNEYVVDSGTIGVVPAALMDVPEDEIKGLGRMVDFGSGFSVEYVGGSFFIGSIEINTEDEEDDGEVCDNCGYRDCVCGDYCDDCGQRNENCTCNEEELDEGKDKELPFKRTLKYGDNVQITVKAASEYLLDNVAYVVDNVVEKEYQERDELFHSNDADEDNELNESAKKSIVDVKVKRGKMHELLNIPDSKDISDKYTSGEALAKALIKATGDRAKASRMLAFAANIKGGKKDLFDKALAACKAIGEKEDAKK